MGGRRNGRMGVLALKPGGFLENKVGLQPQTVVSTMGIVRTSRCSKVKLNGVGTNASANKL